MKIKIIALAVLLTVTSARSGDIPLHKGESRAQVEAKFGHKPQTWSAAAGQRSAPIRPAQPRCSSLSLAAVAVQKEYRVTLPTRGRCDMGDPNHQRTMKRAVLTVFVTMLARSASATLVVHDPIHTLMNKGNWIITEIKQGMQYVKQCDQWVQEHTTALKEVWNKWRMR